MYKNVLSKIDMNKYKINNGLNTLIPMKLFLSFLTVKVERNEKCCGYINGWTEFIGDNNLIIRGGIYKGVEYLDLLSYKKSLLSSCHDFVNPFCLFDIFNTIGKQYFIEYYADEIKTLIDHVNKRIEIAQKEKDVLCSLTELGNGQGNPENFCKVLA